MTWTAKLLDAVERDGRREYAIFYTDGMRKIEKTYVANDLTDEVVKATARAEVAHLSVVKAAAGKLSIDPGDMIDLTAPSVLTPSAEDQARTEFQAALAEVDRCIRNVARGLDSVDDLARAKETLAALNKLEYREMT